MKVRGRGGGGWGCERVLGQLVLQHKALLHHQSSEVTQPRAQTAQEQLESRETSERLTSPRAQSREQKGPFEVSLLAARASDRAASPGPKTRKQSGAHMSDMKQNHRNGLSAESASLAGSCTRSTALIRTTSQGQSGTRGGRSGEGGGWRGPTEGPCNIWAPMHSTLMEHNLLIRSAQAETTSNGREESGKIDGGQEEKENTGMINGGERNGEVGNGEPEGKKRQII